MDDLINRINNLKQMISILDDTEKEKYRNLIKDELENTNNIILSMETKFDQVSIDSSKLIEKNEEFYKQRILAKIMFSNFWGIINFLNDKTLNELIELDKKQNIIN